MEEQQKSGTGAIIGIIIILVVVILAGLYFWGERGEIKDIEMNTDQTAESTTGQAGSDETDNIENDLNNTDLNIDAELNAS